MKDNIWNWIKTKFQTLKKLIPTYYIFLVLFTKHEKNQIEMQKGTNKKKNQTLQNYSYLTNNDYDVQWSNENILTGPIN